MLICRNGELVSPEQAVISPMDHAFLYGHGLFETIRVYDGQPFAFERHCKRMLAGANFLDWPALPSVEVLRQWTMNLLQANHLKDASVRITVSRGAGAPRPDPSACGDPEVIIFTQLLKPPPEETYQLGWQLKTASWPRNQYSPLCRLKSANYLENIIAKQEAVQAGAQEAIFVNSAGHVAEGTMSNLFLIQSGRLFTPDVDSGLLPGITREIILDIAREAGIDTMETKITRAQALQADELFISSSLLEIMPVMRWDGVAIKNDGELIQRLRQLYHNRIRKNREAFSGI